MKLSIYFTYVAIFGTCEAFAPNSRSNAHLKFSTTRETRVFASAVAYNEGEKREINFLKVREITDVTLDHAVPILTSAFSKKHSGVDNFFAAKTTRWGNGEEISNADRTVLALKRLCPTWVKFGSAVASRADYIPHSLAKSFSTANDDIEAFDLDVAKKIIQVELKSMDVSDIKIAILLDTMSLEPVSVKGIEQEYKAYLPDVGDVIIKVQKTTAFEQVEKDAKLLKNIAGFVSTFAKLLPSGQFKTTQLEEFVDTFTSTIIKETDYTNEHVSSEYCTKNILVVKIPDKVDSVEKIDELAMIQQGGSFRKMKLVGGLIRKSENRANMIMGTVLKMLSLGQLELSTD